MNPPQAQLGEAINVEDMKAYEINAVGLGIPLALLMENAGRAVAETIASRLPGLRGRRVAILAGKGGNGGDGFVAARHLAGMGARVEVHLAYPPESVQHPDARANLEVLLNLKSVRLLKPMDRGWLDLADHDVVVDALLGTGVKGSLRGPVAEAVAAYNRAPGLRVSVDVPTGVNPDTGEAVPGAAVSDVTVTMHRVKRGLLEARQYTGEIVVADIGIPPEAWQRAGPGDVAARVPRRPRDAHKGVGGRLLVVAGSRWYVGAPMLASIGAARAGVDLVYLASPERIAFEAAAQCSSIVPVPLGGGHLAPEDLDALRGYLARAHSLVIGPGLGREPETLEAASILMLEAARQGVPVVVDADGLRALPGEGFPEGSRVVLTPHRGEAESLSGYSDPREAAARISSRYKAVALVKGPVDYACQGPRCRENHAGTPAMSVGGTGDVLAGIIGAIMARRLSILGDPDPLNTAVTAAYITGLAGMLAYKEKGEALTAWDIVEIVPRVIADPLAAAQATK